MTLQTRQPTGRAGWPKILVEGGDKSGKSWSLAQLSASPKVGRTVVLALGEDETRWDEYGLIPGARFEIALHDGTWPSIMATVQGAKDEAAKARDAGEPPFVFGFDTVTAEWDGLKDWATWRARNSKKNRALLAQDPNAEIDVTSNYWNDARGRHRALMRLLLTFPGIVVLIARGSEVTAFKNGQPESGKKTWSVEGEKNLPFDVSSHVRLSRDSRPLLVSASGVHCQIRPGIDPPRRLPDDWSLESLIFDTFKLDAATAGVGDFVEMQTADRTPEQIRDEACNPQTTVERIRELWTEARDAGYAGITLINETGDEELLLGMVERIGNERRGAPAAQNGHGAATRQGNGGRPARPAQQRSKAPASEEQWIRDFNAELAATGLDGLPAMRKKVGAAVAEGHITSETSAVLTGSVNKRRENLEKAGAAA